MLCCGARTTSAVYLGASTIVAKTAACSAARTSVTVKIDRRSSGRNSSWLILGNTRYIQRWVGFVHCGLKINKYVKYNSFTTGVAHKVPRWYPTMPSSTAKSTDPCPRATPLRIADFVPRTG